MKSKCIIVSGYFNPLHRGHIEYFYHAKKHSEKLLVIVNNDLQREKKGSKKFMNQDERFLIINELKIVDYAMISIDTGMSVSESIRDIYKKYSSKYELLFGNGGDQNNKLIPEVKTCNELSIKLIDGLGDKIQSSSWLLKNNDEN